MEKSLEYLTTEDIRKLGQEYEAAREAMFNAQDSIRQWCYEHPERALSVGLLRIDYTKAAKL
jgi:hypothetical protein